MPEPLAAHQRLVSALQKVRRSIRQVRERKDRIGEQNTKAVLIDPILSALGWDLLDLDEVFLEYRHAPQDNPVDYALFLHRSPKLFVEAKALETNLDDHKWISQAVNYANAAGVAWCVLTNGEEYRIYNSHAPVELEEKLFRSVSVSDAVREEQTLETLELLSKDKLSGDRIGDLWRAHFVDRHVEEALRGLFDETDPGLVRLIRKRAPGLKPADVRDSLKRSDAVFHFPELPCMAGPEAGEGAAESPAPTAKEPSATSEAQYLVDSVAAPRKRRFRWVLDIGDDGAFVLDCRYLPDESLSFQVTGQRVPPEGDFKGARKQLWQEIYDHMVPLFPDVPDNLVRSRAWSGVHKVYPAKEYGK